MKDESKTHLTSEERIALFGTLSREAMAPILLTYESFSKDSFNKALAYLSSATWTEGNGEAWQDAFDAKREKQEKIALRCCYLADRAYLVEAMLPKELFKILIAPWESVFPSPYYEDYRDELLLLFPNR